MKFGVDLDGCIVNFNEAYARKFRERGYEMPTYADGIEQPPTWNYPEEAFGVPKEVVGEVWKEIDADRNFWRNLRPLPESNVELWKFLNNLTEYEGHEVYYLTLRRGINVHIQTVDWLKAWGIYEPQVIITPRGKARLAIEMALDVVIDDHPGTIKEYRDMRLVRNNAPQVYRVIRPYNSECEGLEPVFAVKTVKAALNHALAPHNELVVV